MARNAGQRYCGCRPWWHRACPDCTLGARTSAGCHASCRRPGRGLRVRREPAHALRLMGRVVGRLVTDRCGRGAAISPQRARGLPHRRRWNPMSFNTFGHLFRVTTFGESHGAAIGCVVDGCPPRIALTEADIQPYLDKRRPGQSRFTTQRREPDEVKILSGVFFDEATGQQVTTGTPIALVIDNVDQRSKDYSDIKDKYRPGHADFTYDAKYGIRDYRGGGRQSARETACRVAAGALARKILGAKLGITGYLVQIGRDGIDRGRFDPAEIERNPFWCPDAAAAERWESLLGEVRKSGSSVGAVIEVVATGVPAGLG